MDTNRFCCLNCETHVTLVGCGTDWPLPEGVDPTRGLCASCADRLGLEVRSVETDHGMLQRVEHRGWRYTRTLGSPVFFRVQPARKPDAKPLPTDERRTTKVVLIVDDDVEVQEAIGDVLEEQGYRVTGAVSGLEAMEMISRRRYDLVLLDVGLPQYNGLAVLDRLRHLDDRFGSLTPVIVMTGDPEADKRTLAETLRISAFLSKPFSLGRLLNHTQEVLSAAS